MDCSCVAHLVGHERSRCRYVSVALPLEEVQPYWKDERVRFVTFGIEHVGIVDRNLKRSRELHLLSTLPTCPGFARGKQTH